MSEKLPAMQFYTGDWLKDPGVRSLSLAARGLWFDLLCYMHESERRGFLIVGKSAPTEVQLARMLGARTRDLQKHLHEIEKAGVSSRDEHGVLYSRRMVKDQQKRELCRKAGRKGGNPALNPTLNPTLKGQEPSTLKRNPTPSVSVSSSTSVTPGGESQTLKGQDPREEQDAIEVMQNQYGLDVDQIYEAYPRKENPRGAKEAICRAIRRGEPPADLLRKTETFAKTVSGQDPKYIQKPATWFDEDGFNSDPAAWASWKNQAPAQPPVKRRMVV